MISARSYPLVRLSLLSCVVLACAPETQEEETGSRASPAPNIVLYIVDTLRADTLGCYGHPVVETPNVDSFAAEGTLFANAFVQSSWTRASIASILSSTYPGVHGAEGRDDLLSEAPVLLSEMLSAHGYRTCLITTNPNVGSFFGFQQGFDDFVELYKRRDTGFVKATELATTGDVVAERALDWVRSVERPFCLIVLTIDPHSPYEPPDEFDRYGGDYSGPLVGIKEWINRKRLSPEEKERIRSLYYGEVAFNDHAFGALVDGLREAGVYDETICVYTSDHGEEFWEHGDRGHGKTLYDEAIRVPLIIRYPESVGAGERVADDVEAIDIVPTLLDLAGLPIPEVVDGGSLFRRTDGDVFSSLRHNRRSYVAVRRGNWKLLLDLESGDRQLFNLLDIEREQRNRASEQPELADELGRVAAERVARNRSRREQLHAATGVERVLPADLPEEELEALRSLGYLGSEQDE